MLYALDTKGIKIRPQKGLSGVCPDCGDALIPKCGEINTWHWAHKSDSDCEVWSEGEGEWHLAWKSLWPPECVEIPIIRNGIRHRADILSPKGVVIELQHSPISLQTIREREDFYGDMVWLFDVTSSVEFDRIQFRIREKDNGTRFVSVFWKNPKRCFEHVTKECYWDIGNDKLFSLKSMKRSNAWGYFSSKQLFVERFTPMLELKSLANTKLPDKQIKLF